MRFLLLLTLLTHAAVPFVANGQTPEPVQSVRMGLRVFPDTVTIGQPFRLTVRAVVQPGARISMPEGPDTTADDSGIRPVELRGPRSLSMTADTAVAFYSLVAWDTGAQQLRMPDIVVTIDGSERRASLAGASVFVKSVLPADTTLRVPRPARAAIVLPTFNWWPWIAALAVALLALLLWFVWRKLRNRPPLPVDPYLRAQQAFARIEKLELIRQGRSEEYVEAVVDVARVYLAARIPGVRRSNTTAELLDAMQSRASVAGDLTPVLETADLVKFARGTVSDDEAVRGGAIARAAVEAVESAHKAETLEKSKARAA